MLLFYLHGVHSPEKPEEFEKGQEKTWKAMIFSYLW